MLIDELAGRLRLRSSCPAVIWPRLDDDPFVRGRPARLGGNDAAQEGTVGSHSESRERRDGEGGSETASSSRARSPGQGRRPTPQHSLGGSMATAVMAAWDQRGEWTLSGCELKLVVRAGHTKRRGHDGSSSEMEGCRECRWMGWLRVGMSV
jgi:hypothetical protein